jgi:DNA-binding NarL/FixJ family response regulator
MNPRLVRRLSVLVAEGSLAVRHHLCAVVNDEPGFRLVGATESGARALEWFSTHRPEVVLLDVCLPDTSGFDVLRCIRNSAPGCVVVMLSDSQEPLVREASRLLGAAEFIHKASEVGQVIHILRRLVHDRLDVSAEGESTGAARHTDLCPRTSSVCNNPTTIKP